MQKIISFCLSMSLALSLHSQWQTIDLNIYNTNSSIEELSKQISEIKNSENNL